MIKINLLTKKKFRTMKPSLNPLFSNLPASFSELDDYFTNNWPSFGLEGFAGWNRPALNIRETKESYIVELAAPGLQKDKFNIDLSDYYLTLSYEDRESMENEEEGYSRREFVYNSFKRKLKVPENVNTEAISAEYNNGVLFVTLPLVEVTNPNPTRTIAVT